MAEAAGHAASRHRDARSRIFTIPTQLAFDDADVMNAPAATSYESDAERIRSVDLAELKYDVPGGDLDSVASALGDLIEVDPRQVYYFDTPQLDLFRQGVVLRARRRSYGDTDTVVKLRPVAPEETPPVWCSIPGFTIEADIGPCTRMFTLAQKGVAVPGLLQMTVDGERPVAELFSERQHAMLSQCSQAGIDWQTLLAHGPVQVVRVRGTARPLGLRIVAQLWRYPDGSTVLDLSTKLRPRDLDVAGPQWRSMLRILGFDPALEHLSKTERTLTYFAQPAGRSAQRVACAA